MGAWLKILLVLGLVTTGRIESYTTSTISTNPTETSAWIADTTNTTISYYGYGDSSTNQTTELTTDYYEDTNSSVNLTEDASLSVPLTVYTTPDRGPQAGGTNLTITIKPDTTDILAVYLKISEGNYKVCDIVQRFIGGVIARTPSHDDSLITDIVLKINADNSVYNWNTDHQFTYKPNPQIGNIQPNSTLLGGGTKLTVSGSSIDSVAQPKIQFGVDDCFVIQQQAQFIEDCLVQTEDKMFCLTPNVSVCNATQSQTASSTDANQEEIKLYIQILGFILDGDANYNDLSKHPDLPSTISAFEPPVVYTISTPLQYKKGEPLAVRGEHMDRGATAGDYVVLIGRGTCLLSDESLTSTSLVCVPPKPIPPKLSQDKYHRIRVAVGNYEYEYGSIWYPWWYDMKIIIPAAVGGGMLIFIIISSAWLISSERKKRRRRRERKKQINLGPVVTEDMEQAMNRGNIYLPPVKADE